MFPEHRNIGGNNKEEHADGQIINWALWNVRKEYLDQSLSGAETTNVNLMKAMTTAGMGVISSLSDRSVHDSFVDLERQMIANSGTSWLTIKIISGFARAGLFLSDREAIIDIDDDYLARNSATPPTFTVWTGRDYTFDVNGDALTTGALPYNTRYQIEVANDASFTTNYFSSGWLTNVTTSTGGTATWELPAASWGALKTGARLYYRVQTTDSGGGNARNSQTTGDMTLSNMNVPYADISDNGKRPLCIIFPNMRQYPKACYAIYDPWWKVRTFNCLVCAIEM